MKTLIFWSLIFSTVNALALKGNMEISYGRAESAKTGKLLYFEKHETVFGAKNIETIKTEYFKPQNNKFATLDSDFRVHPYLPDYTFKDDRFGREDGVKNIENGKSLETFAKPKSDSKFKTVKRSFDKILVSGQGLHTYIHKNLRELSTKEKSTDVLFLIPMNHKAYKFEIKRMKITDQKVVFKVKIKNWFLSMFAPSLQVTYDLKSKRLLMFEGASNINSDDNKTQNVKIIYSYDKPPKGMKLNE